MAYNSNTFLSWNDIQPWISGVLTDQTDKRNNFLQGFFNTANPAIIERDNVNFDRDFNIRNVIGQFVHPRGEQSEIQERGYDSMYFDFSYFKEPWSSPEYDNLIHRNAGQQLIDIADIMGQYRRLMDQKVYLAYMARENLLEWVASQILLTGGYVAESEMHPRVVYNFQRPVMTDATYTDLKGTVTFADATAREKYLDSRRVSQVDLTTLTVNGGVGKRAWGSTGGTKSVSPYTDVTLIIQGALQGSGTPEAIIMSTDAYALYLADPLWEKASQTTYNWQTALSAQILPQIKDYRGLTWVNTHVAPGGIAVPIYTYTANYTDRVTGVETSFLPDGYVIALPARSYGLTAFGRIKNKKANYAAMPIWINTWSDEKDGGENWEMHSNFVLGHTKIQDIICWKVK